MAYALSLRDVVLKKENGKPGEKGKLLKHFYYVGNKKADVHDSTNIQQIMILTGLYEQLTLMETAQDLVGKDSTVMSGKRKFMLEIYEDTAKYIMKTMNKVLYKEPPFKDKVALALLNDIYKLDEGYAVLSGVSLLEALNFGILIANNLQQVHEYVLEIKYPSKSTQAIIKMNKLENDFKITKNLRLDKAIK